MAAETGFLIEGTVYEPPTLDSLSMGERRLMFELCGLAQEDFVRTEDESEEEHDDRVEQMTRHPGFVEALMHIAYQRANPTVKRAKVAFVVEETNYIDAVKTLRADDEDDDAVPLALTTEPEGSSPRSTSSPSEPSGPDSTDDSAAPAAPPTPIGTTRSATSSPESPLTESVG